jgi:hypothetical protein
MAKKARKNKRGTAFVPTIVFSTSVLGVVPACAIGCGGTTSSGTSTVDGSADAARDVFFGVAAVAYCAYSNPNCWTVVAVGFDSGLGDVSDAESDAAKDGGTDADAGTTGTTCPPFCAVAFMGFDAGIDANEKDSSDKG